MKYKTVNILFVEDSDTDYELMLHALNKDGFMFDAFRATTLLGFTRLISSCNPNIVISDYNLIGFTGIDVVNTFTDQKIDVPIVIVSSNIGEEKAVEALKLGATDYMLKSHIKKLPHVIKRSLDEWSTKAQEQETLSALRRREKMYSSLLNTMKDGLIQLNPNLDITYANPAFVDMVGYTKTGQLIGKNICELFADKMQRITKNNIELININKQIVYCELSKSALIDDLNSFALVFKNITSEVEQKRISTELNNELDLLIYRIAHDLRGPICSLEGLLELISDTTDKQWYGLATSQLSTSYTILDKLTTLVMVKKHELKLKETNISSLITTLAKKYKDITFLYSKLPYNIKTDSVLLMQALEPIIENAIKYKSEERIAQITFDLNEDNDHTILSITDNGIGINPDKLSHVLDMFYKANKNSGLGLGLYMCKIIAEKLGGSIVMNSELDSFTSVSLKIAKKNKYG